MSRLAALLPDVLVVLGLVAVAVGAGLVYLPAGLIVGGVLAVVFGTVKNMDRLAADDGLTDSIRREGAS